MNCRFLNSLITALSLLVMLGCYGGDLNPVGSSRNGVDANVSKNSSAKVDLELVTLDNSETQNTADLVFRYVLNGIDVADLPPGASIVLTILDQDGNTIVVSEPLELATDSNEGEITVSVPANYDSVSAVATLQSPDSQGSDNGSANSESTDTTAVAPDNSASQNSANTNDTTNLEPQGVLLDIPLRNALLPTRLTTVSDYSLELVEESYSSVQAGQRRVHRFALRAYDQQCVSIRGLKDDVGEYFKLYEGDVLDVESPVTFDSRDNVVRVYLVLDASSSITSGAGAEGAVRAAVENVAAAMPDDYTIDVRQFTGTVEKLGHYKDYDPDLNESATAFYYAIDTVLDDIENQGLSNDYNVIIAFTDGLDLSSRNYFGAGYTHDSVKQYVTQRVRTFRTTDGPKFGAGLELHVLSMGSVAETDRHNLESLSSAGDGVYHHAIDKTELELKFDNLAEHVLATYHLEYNSQQLPDDSKLELRASINGIEKTLLLRDAGGLTVVTAPSACRVQP